LLKISSISSPTRLGQTFSRSCKCTECPESRLFKLRI